MERSLPLQLIAFFHNSYPYGLQRIFMEFIISTCWKHPRMSPVNWQLKSFVANVVPCSRAFCPCGGVCGCDGGGGSGDDDGGGGGGGGGGDYDVFDDNDDDFCVV
jgi:hypothetical protein